MSSHFKKVSANALILPHSLSVSLFNTEVWVNRFSFSTLKMLIHCPLACKVFNRKATVILIFCSSVCNVLFFPVFLQDFLINFCIDCDMPRHGIIILLRALRFLNLFVIKFGKILVIISSNIFLLPHSCTPRILAVQLCPVMSSYTLYVLIFPSALAC